MTTNYRRIGITRFVLASFVRTAAEVQGIKETLKLPLKVARPTVPLSAMSTAWLALAAALTRRHS